MDKKLKDEILYQLELLAELFADGDRKVSSIEDDAFARITLIENMLGEKDQSKK